MRIGLNRDIADGRQESSENYHDTDIGRLAESGNVKPLEHRLDVVRSEESWVKESGLDFGNDTIAEGKVCEEGCQDRDTNSNKEQSKTGCQRV